MAPPQPLAVEGVARGQQGAQLVAVGRDPPAQRSQLIGAIERSGPAAGRRLRHAHRVEPHGDVLPVELLLDDHLIRQQAGGLRVDQHEVVAHGHADRRQVRDPGVRGWTGVTRDVGEEHGRAAMLGRLWDNASPR